MNHQRAELEVEDAWGRNWWFIGGSLVVHWWFIGHSLLAGPLAVVSGLPAAVRMERVAVSRNVVGRLTLDRPAATLSSSLALTLNVEGPAPLNVTLPEQLLHPQAAPGNLQQRKSTG